MTGFIFDLDGTLANSIANILETSRKTCDALGIEVSDETIADYVGIPLIQTGEELLGIGGGEKFMQTYMDIYAQSHFQVQPYEGIPQLMEKLAQAGAQIGLCTSKRRLPTHENLETMGIKKYFSAIIHSESGYGFKPEPGPPLAAADLMGVEPQKCWFIGDSIHDMISGKAAGMGAIGVLWGVGTKAELREGGAQYLCTTVDQLQELLLNIIE